MDEIQPFLVLAFEEGCAVLVAGGADPLRIDGEEEAGDTVQADQDHLAGLTCVGDIPYADPQETGQIRPGGRLFGLVFANLRGGYPPCRSTESALLASPLDAHGIANRFERNALKSVFAIHHRQHRAGEVEVEADGVHGDLIQGGVCIGSCPYAWGGSAALMIRAVLVAAGFRAEVAQSPIPVAWIV